MRDARKLFRLFKWLFEIKKIRALVQKPPSSADELELLLSKPINSNILILKTFDYKSLLKPRHK